MTLNCDLCRKYTKTRMQETAYPGEKTIALCYETFSNPLKYFYPLRLGILPAPEFTSDQDLTPTRPRILPRCIPEFRPSRPGISPHPAPSAAAELSATVALARSQINGGTHIRNRSIVCSVPRAKRPASVTIQRASSLTCRSEGTESAADWHGRALCAARTGHCGDTQINR